MINVNQQALLELLKASLFGTDPSFPIDTDWNAVLQEAEDQTVVALAAPAIPDREAEKWEKRIRYNKMRFMQILTEQTNLVRVFHDAGIPLVILKGCAAATYYPEPVRRTMGDIDFVVPPEQFDDARHLMEENGYQFDHDLGDDRDYCFYKNKVSFELHHHYSDNDWDIEPFIMNGMAHPEICEIYNNKFPALPTEINGLVLLDHVRHHLYGGLGIRQIIDWMMFVHVVLDDKTWETRFAPLARDAGLETFAITMTKMCRLWFGLPDAITWCDSANIETAQQLLETVFDFGNFGIKTPYVYRPMENLSMGVRKQGFFRFLQTTGTANWKACQKHRFLRPFAWLYQLFRFTGRGFKALFRGEHLAKDAAKGTKKADFYERLGLNR